MSLKWAPPKCGTTMSLPGEPLCCSTRNRKLCCRPPLLRPKAASILRGNTLQSITVGFKARSSPRCVLPGIFTTRLRLTRLGGRMDIYYYNTLTRAKDKFEPLSKHEVTMYTCGPTVYRYVHIGNLRTWLMSDLIRRVVEFRGYKVKQVMNITDGGHMDEDDSLTITPGEDKVLAAAAAEKKTPEEIAALYTPDFMDPLGQMNTQKAFDYPKAHDH